MLDNESNFDIGAQKLLKSHEILKKSIFKVNDPLQSFANHLNFMFLPMVVQKMEEQGLIKIHEFLIENKQMVCLDGTYDCKSVALLNQWEHLFYGSYNYKEAIELIEFILNRTEEELILEGIDSGEQKQANYRTGMIYMKWGEYDKALEGFLNAEKLVLKYKNDTYDDGWSPHYKLRIGHTMGVSTAVETALAVQEESGTFLSLGAGMGNVYSSAIVEIL